MNYNDRVSARNPFRRGFSVLDDFGRACDEMFEELLISRWREHRRRPAGPMAAIDRGSHFEVRIAAHGVDPKAIEVEVSEWHLSVRIPVAGRMAVRSLELSAPVDAAATRAHWSDGILEIIMPKQLGRRIDVE